MKNRYLCLGCKGSGVDPKRRKLQGRAECYRRCEECRGEGYVLVKKVKLGRKSY